MRSANHDILFIYILHLTKCFRIGVLWDINLLAKTTAANGLSHILFLQPEQLRLCSCEVLLPGIIESDIFLVLHFTASHSEQSSLLNV